ncbi:hypothetical protein [Streptomyces sp. AM8-1-1]|uniref:hypothetical protein n=1 Tax=Streptomyces sp. AM8-1-1 TaxID=3075825 RepID=UPI0028C3C2FD|nr:hypothetical protein [Streptomyces sp. AM8-1-1]WNO76802.1 hypothetical protein RPQ07_36525 [Streptomyces sp. AM8-1-1]
MVNTNSLAPPRRIAAVIACLLVLVGCNPHMYDEVPAVHDAKRAEIVGSWLGFDRTEVTLQSDGKAVISLLDGQEFDFDDRWRLSGTGEWELTDERTGWNDGQHVQLTLTSRMSSTTRTPDPAERLDPSPERGPAPETYRWTFELQRDDKKQLMLYFFFGDPDSRSTYVLERK